MAMGTEQEDQNGAVSEREQREQNENALVLAQESFDLIFEDAPVMMHSIDGEGKLLRVNRRWVETLGYDSDEIQGHKSVDFLTDESQLRAEEDTLPLLWRAGAARSVGLQFVKKDGEPLDISLDAEVSYTPSGRTFALGALRDRLDTAQWRQASATIRALKELADLQLELEAALSSEGGLPLAEHVSDPPPGSDIDSEHVPPGLLMIDLKFHRVTIDGRLVKLTAKEWAMLRVLVKNAGRVIVPR